MPRKATALRSDPTNQATGLITPQDLEIFRRGAINANYITDFYTRTETSGDYWRNRSVDDPEYDPERQIVWELIHAQWLKDGKPDKHITWQSPREIRFFSIWGWTPIRFNVVQTNGSEPIFHHNHGWLFQPWQLEVHHAPQPDATIIGGFGCISYSSRLWNVDTNQYESVGSLSDKQVAPTVLAWDGDGFVPVKATIPFKKGTTALYRVTTRSGKQIEVTAEHRFLTPAGYRRLEELSVGDLLLGCGGGLLQSSSGFCLTAFRANDPHLSQIILDSQSDYLAYCRSCDERPRSAPSSAPGELPSPSDVHEPSPNSSHEDDQEHKLKYTHLHQASDRPSSRDVSLRAERPDSPEVVSRCDAGSGVSAPRPQCRLEHLSFPRNSYPTPPSAQDCPCVRPESTASFCDESDLGGFVPHDALLPPRGCCIQYQGIEQQQLQSRAHPSTSENLPVSISTNQYHVDNPYSKSSCNYYITEEEVVGIDAVGIEAFYDLHVPVHENYVAEGLVHHNTGKTAMVAMSLAVLAITVPNFRGFAIAPQMIQATEVYQYLNTTLQGTPYWSRFVHRNPERPWPKFIVRNSYIGQSTIEIYSLENDPEKIRTLEGDVAFLDQAEKFENLDDIERDLGSRLRGTVKGRPRIGRMIWIANAGDNPLLWDRFDMGEHQPRNYLSRNPRSIDNPYLSKRDIENLKRRVGGSAEEVAVWLEGKRPMGSGEHFTREMVRLCTDEGLNATMDNALRMPDDDPRRQSFVHHYTQQLGTFVWEMPPENNLKRDYIVISDPGSSDPPHRNSAAIMVFDVTEFPERPMVMRAFNWIYGHGSYWPWVMTYKDYVEKYNAYGRNAFDSTGVQKGFDELVFHEMKLAAEGMNMAVGGKMMALNSLKFFMGKGMIKFPYISYLSNQLTNFKLPDNKIRQDLVMCLSMAAAWARRLYYVELDDEKSGTSTSLPGPIERYDRSAEADRYGRSSYRR